MKAGVPIFSPKMEYWHFEAHQELGLQSKAVDRTYAIFPRRFYKTVQTFDQTKRYDFCFIGAYLIDEPTAFNRAWIVGFIRENFTPRSYLQFTDRKTKRAHKAMGPFDHTFERDGFVPKEVDFPKRNFFDAFYYQAMCNSQFAPCPAGDFPWSMRFYEALMCKSIPILRDNTGFRTREEQALGYRYLTVGERFVYSPDWVEHNYEIFLKYHTLDGAQKTGKA